MIHVAVRGAVDGAFCGELQGVEKSVALDTEGAVQVEHRVTDPTRPVVHQLERKNREVG